MTVKEIADTLNECARQQSCDKCEFKDDPECKSKMVVKMGAEVRKMVEVRSDRESDQSN